MAFSNRRKTFRKRHYNATEGNGYYLIGRSDALNGKVRSARLMKHFEYCNGYEAGLNQQDE